ncbi:MAG: hypothetical protein ACR2G6_05005 [Gemmatimonadaceae bacterium]
MIHFRGLVVALAVVLSAVACTGDKGITAPLRRATPSLETTVIASAHGQSTANDVLLLQAISLQLDRTSAPGARRALVSLDITYGGVDCTYNIMSLRFVCPAVAMDSMTISAEYALYDALGASQMTYNDITTASAQVWYKAFGNLVNPTGAADIDRVRTLTVNGLSGTESQRTFGGSGTDQASGTITGSPGKTYVLSDTTIAPNVVYGIPLALNVWPRSGTLTTKSQLNVTELGVTTTTNKSVVITFNGTRLVNMDVGSTGFTLDLATGGVVAR